MTSTLAFIGGGNMASAIIGGLVRAGHPPDRILVVEPAASQHERLRRHGVTVLPAATAALGLADTIVWAVKPQGFVEAAAPCAAHVRGALQLSVMAGIRSEAIVQATGSMRVVRAMPNTPALIGAGISGLYARDEVTDEERARAERLLEPTGRSLWVEQETDLDAVTALSGSGPAYVFYFIEAMVDAAVEMGLTPQQGHQLAVYTFAGATALVRHSDEPPAVLRERVTSKGGTTHAALSSLQADHVREAFIKAIRAAQQRAQELGDEFG